jgi:hypothetical protein
MRPNRENTVRKTKHNDDQRIDLVASVQALRHDKRLTQLLKPTLIILDEACQELRST